MNKTITIADLPSHEQALKMPADLNKGHEIFESLAKQYGKAYTVKFAKQPMLVVSDPQLIQEVLAKRPEYYAPFQRNSNILAAIKSDGIEASDGESWQLQREMLHTAMEFSYLKQYFKHIKRITAELLKAWQIEAPKLSPMVLHEQLMGYSINVYAAILFGDMTQLPADKRQQFQQQLEQLIALLAMRIDALLPQMDSDSFNQDNDFEQQMSSVINLIEELIKQLQQTKQDELSSMLQVLLNIIAKNKWTHKQAKLTKNILQILFAAEPTTANTLIRTLYYIAENPQLQQLIQSEIDSLIGEEINDITQLKQLKYIEAAIYETMRIASVSRLVSVESKQKQQLANIEIPQGLSLVLLIGYCGLQESNFQNAATFDFQRWHADSKSEYKPHNPKAALGFGAGPRSCPGRGLAMVVIKTAIAMLCEKFVILPVEQQGKTATAFAFSLKAR